jgi:hypothetical protein
MPGLPTTDESVRARSRAAKRAQAQLEKKVKEQDDDAIDQAIDAWDRDAAETVFMRELVDQPSVDGDSGG